MACGNRSGGDCRCEKLAARADRGARSQALSRLEKMLWLAVAAFVGMAIIAAATGCKIKTAGDTRRHAPEPCPDGQCPYETVAFSEIPVVNLPSPARQRNWTRYGEGSCVIASTVMMFRWQGRDDLADAFRRKYGGGHTASMLHADMDQENVRYATTTTGDVRFLEWAMRTRRGAGITFFPSHFVCLVHLDAERAGILDNNRTDRIIWIGREEFIRRWRGYGGWATTPVYSPAPPLPFRRA